MERNYKKEAEWAKEKYKRYGLRLDKSVAEAFEKKLKRDKKSFSIWIKKKIDEYIKS